MLRAQSVVVKNKKKSQTSKVNKTKSAKSEIHEKIKSKRNAVDTESADAKLATKVQGQTQIEMDSSHPLTDNTIPTIDLGDRKFERSNSFFLTRKLSKIYNSLTNSKESLKDNDVNTDVHDKTEKKPFKFIRSVSLATISLKKDYRNSVRKPRLEQLSEEDHPHGVTVSKSKSRTYDKKKASTASIDSLSSRTSDKSSIISSFKRTFSLTPSRRKPTNPKWSASLMSLQQIDVMISYEDLSFIDYDKFNTYEENLMTKIKSSNHIDVNRLNAHQFPGVKMRSRTSSATQQRQRRHSTIMQSQNDGTNQDTDDLLNVNSKRWSNPCFGPNSAECATFASLATIPTIPHTDDIDECDFNADVAATAQPTNNYFNVNNSSAMHATRSIDDLTITSNERNNLPLQTVSESNLQFHSFNSNQFKSLIFFQLSHVFIYETML